MQINVLPTDKEFKDSPGVGPDCTCSRCGEPILKGVPIRCWPDDIGQNPDASEWRFHPQCLGFKVYEDEEIYFD